MGRLLRAAAALVAHFRATALFLRDLQVFIVLLSFCIVPLKLHAGALIGAQAGGAAPAASTTPTVFFPTYLLGQLADPAKYSVILVDSDGKQSPVKVTAVGDDDLTYSSSASNSFKPSGIQVSLDGKTQAAPYCTWAAPEPEILTPRLREDQAESLCPQGAQGADRYRGCEKDLKAAVAFADQGGACEALAEADSPTRARILAISPDRASVEVWRPAGISVKSLDLFRDGGGAAVSIETQPTVEASYTIQSKALTGHLFGSQVNDRFLLAILSVTNREDQTVQFHLAAIRIHAHCVSESHDAQTFSPVSADAQTFSPVSAQDLLAVRGGANLLYSYVPTIVKGAGGVLTTWGQGGAGALIRGSSFLPIVSPLSVIALPIYSHFMDDQAKQYTANLVADTGQDIIQLGPGESRSVDLLLPKEVCGKKKEPAEFRQADIRLETVQPKASGAVAENVTNSK
jgi:hypothetical protein